MKLHKDNKKSFNIKMLESNEYKAIIIPTKKLRTFLESDFTVLFNKDDKDIQ